MRGKAALALFILNTSSLHVTAQEIVNGHPALAYWTVPSAATNAADRMIVVVHGGPGVSHRYLRPELDRYARWGEVVYYDQRGCGASEGAASYGWEDHVEDLNRLINVVRGNRRVVLVGSSWGAFLIEFYLRVHHEGVEAAILSGMSSGASAPRELAERLVRCGETKMATVRGMESAPTGIGSVDAFRLTFLDSGQGGRAAPALSGAFRRWFVTLPSHDPWFTHHLDYFSAVTEFFMMLDDFR